jgi:hypothetical protein
MGAPARHYFTARRRSALQIPPSISLYSPHFGQVRAACFFDRPPQGVTSCRNRRSLACSTRSVRPVGLGHHSRRTEEAYVHWIQRFILFRGKPHPAEMAEPEVVASS